LSLDIILLFTHLINLIIGILTIPCLIDTIIGHHLIPLIFILIDIGFGMIGRLIIRGIVLIDGLSLVMTDGVIITTDGTIMGGIVGVGMDTMVTIGVGDNT